MPFLVLPTNAQHQHVDDFGMVRACEDGVRMIEIIISVQCLDDGCFCVLLFLMYYCLCCCHSSFEGLQ